MSKFKIALIDDDGEDCELFTTALTETSPNVHLDCYSNCNTFMDESLSLPPDLIFIDLYLPMKHGVDCIAEFKSLPHLHKIPLIVYTGASDIHEKINKTIELGAKIYFEKPGDYKELINTLKQIMSFDWANPNTIEPTHIKKGNFTPLLNNTN